MFSVFFSKDGYLENKKHSFTRLLVSESGTDEVSFSLASTPIEKAGPLIYAIKTDATFYLSGDQLADLIEGLQGLLHLLNTRPPTAPLDLKVIGDAILASGPKFKIPPIKFRKMDEIDLPTTRLSDDALLAFEHMFNMMTKTSGGHLLDYKIPAHLLNPPPKDADPGTEPESK